MKMNWLKKLVKEEDGQDLVEFALVLPIFLLLIMGIMDFGWLFYNYISVENSARNAARIACVEYSDCCYDEINFTTSAKDTFTYLDLNRTDDSITDSERNIVAQVQETLPASIKSSTVNVKILYTYDAKMIENNEFDVKNRSKGDVKVTVSGEWKSLTPLMMPFCDEGRKSERIKTLHSTSTFKVEKIPTED